MEGSKGNARTLGRVLLCCGVLLTGEPVAWRGGKGGLPRAGVVR